MSLPSAGNIADPINLTGTLEYAGNDNNTDAFGVYMSTPYLNYSDSTAVTMQSILNNATKQYSYKIIPVLLDIGDSIVVRTEKINKTLTDIDKNLEIVNTSVGFEPPYQIVLYVTVRSEVPF